MPTTRRPATAGSAAVRYAGGAKRLGLSAELPEKLPLAGVQGRRVDLGKHLQRLIRRFCAASSICASLSRTTAACSE